MEKSELLNTFFQSRKNANCLLDLEKSLLSNDVSCVLRSIEIVKDVITEIFNRNMLHILPDIGDDEKKYNKWLNDRYQDFITHLETYLSNGDESVQEKALGALMSFVVLEGGKPLKVVKKNTWYFPKVLFQKIVNGMASEDLDQQILISKFEEYSLYDDVKMYLLKGLINIFEKTEKVTDVFLLNCFHLLNSFKYPKEFSSEDKESHSTSTLLSREGLQSPFQLKEKLFCKLFSTAWTQFLNFQLPPAILKRVLVILHKRIIPHLQNPCLMTDFLTDAYKKGGLTSLLALNGLYFLITKYNVEYADFFSQLYALFDEKIVNGKFSARFFYLSDLFLSSTHLPAYTVAAFAKRLSRIALRSRTDTLLKIIPFICNLLIRHPTLNILIHRSPSNEISRDPFDFNATDPSKANALESSLWEIKTLQCHVNPDVSRKAKLINNPLPTLEFDLSKVIDESMCSIYKTERKRKFVGAPTAVKKPCKLENWWTFPNMCKSA